MSVPCKICRVCLENIDIDKSVYLYDDTKAFPIFEQINSLVNVHLEVDDGFPDYICADCSLDLQNALDFKRKCEHSDVLLHSGTVGLHGIQIKDSIKKEEESLGDASPKDYDEDDNFNSEYIDECFENENKVKEETEKELIKTVPSKRKSGRKKNIKLGMKVVSKKPKNTANKRKYNANRESRAVDLQLECNDCGGLFKSKCKLSIHWKREHMLSRLICQVCKRTFKTYKAYHVHRKQKSKFCSAANQFHIEGIGKSRIFYCKVCNYNSKLIQSLITHSVVHTGEKPFKCDLCPEAYSQLNSLRGHKEAHHNKSKKHTTCHICGKIVIGRAYIYEHLRTHKNMSVSCDICHKMFKSPQTLKQHMIRHTNVKEYACELCGKAFFTYPELYAHKKSIHLKNKFYKCDICGYTNIRSSIINRHKKRHTGTNVPCLICGKFLESSQILTLHQKKHLDRKYSCPHCDLKFYSRKCVMSHIRKQHKMKMVFTKAEEPLKTNNTEIDDIKQKDIHSHSET